MSGESHPIERIDNSATAALFMLGMVVDKLDPDAHADELELLAAVEALLQRIEELVVETPV